MTHKHTARLDPDHVNDTLQTFEILDVSDDERQQYIEIMQKTIRYCEFCHIPEGILPLHVLNLPRQKKDTPNALQNYCVICEHCYKAKGNRVEGVDPRSGKIIPLFHPRKDIWKQHFSWEIDHITIKGLTIVGRATVAITRMNSESMLERRKQGLRDGWHQPDITDKNLSTAYFPPRGKIRLQIRNPNNNKLTELILDPMRGLVLGRNDPSPVHRVDIRLESFGGYRMGVSRRHAIINPPRENRLTISDLGSSNGTSVNGKPISPNESQILNHGDEIKLGKLEIYVYFEYPTLNVDDTSMKPPTPN